jgi:hypothetical protein
MLAGSEVFIALNVVNKLKMIVCCCCFSVDGGGGGGGGVGFLLQQQSTSEQIFSISSTSYTTQKFHTNYLFQVLPSIKLSYFSKIYYQTQFQ